MKLLRAIYVLSSCLLLAMGVHGDANPDPFIWPLPHTYSIEPSPSITISPLFTFECPSSSNEIITNAMTRYMALTYPHQVEFEGPFPPNTPLLKTLAILIDDDSTPLAFEMDESYVLNISTPVATLSAPSLWGALRGLETFSQVVIYNFTRGVYQSFTALINDMPRFAHRGLLIDSSRHFESIPSIKRVLDAMSYARLNVLHWHIVDSQSFPYELKTYPRLWTGAYSRYEKYSVKDVQEVVAYAKMLGIRVIPEFDMPGHAQSWCRGYPEICPSPSCLTPLNPAVNATWDLITSLIKESVATGEIFQDNWIHLGGDEVSTACWSESPSISAWMAENNYTTRAAYGYFVERAIDIAWKEFDLQVINWVEVFNNFNTSLNPNSTVIEIWKPKIDLKAAVEDGFRAILADSDRWYLDHLQVSWQTMYSNEPLSDLDDESVEIQERVIGGEACMWGETVDGSDIDATIWPRAAAVAERLWSRRSVNDTDKAHPRLEYFRCLLNQRGIGAAPVNNDVAREAPPRPGSCYEQ